MIVGGSISGREINDSIMDLNLNFLKANNKAKGKQMRSSIIVVKSESFRDTKNGTKSMLILHLQVRFHLL